MAAVFRDTLAAIERAKARDPDDFLVLSRDRSAWSAEHLFAGAISMARARRAAARGYLRSLSSRAFAAAIRASAAAESIGLKVPRRHDSMGVSPPKPQRSSTVTTSESQSCISATRYMSM